MASTHGGHNMHGGKHHPAGAKKTGSHYGKNPASMVATHGKRPSGRSLNPSSMKKPKGA